MDIDRAESAKHDPPHCLFNSATASTSQVSDSLTDATASMLSSIPGLSSGARPWRRPRTVLSLLLWLPDTQCREHARQSARDVRSCSLRYIERSAALAVGRSLPAIDSVDAHVAAIVEWTTVEEFPVCGLGSLPIFQSPSCRPGRSSAVITTCGTSSSRFGCQRLISMPGRCSTGPGTRSRHT